MNSWNSLPLFRLIIPFIIGIVFSELFYFNALGSVICVVAIFSISLSRFKLKYSNRWVHGFMAYLLFFAIGIYSVPNVQDENQTNFFGNYLSKNSILQLDICGVMEEKENSFKTIARVLSVDKQQSCGKLLVYFNKDVKNILHGDKLLCISNPQEIESPKNPHQFDYKSYLKRKNINYQIYIDKGDFIKIDSTKGFTFNSLIIRTRTIVLNRLKSGNIDDNQMAICTALLLGDKSEMDHNIKQTFSQAGVMHVLAVSGLHVGILYVLLSSILSFLDKNKLGQLFKVVLVIGGLWSYAFITSLSPSVMRAATMFSFITISTVIDSKTNIYNTLAASAFLLLFINPLMLFEVGFQLSYIAVLGIVCIYPKLYGLLQFNIKLIDYFWQIIVVSLAAQLVTFPLSVFYFHQFSNYFLISNLVVIPCIPFIIYFGLAYLLFFEISFLSEPIALILNLIIESLVKILSIIKNLPYSISEFLFLDIIQTLLIYSAFSALLLLVYTSKKYWLIVFAFLVIIFQMYFIVWIKPIKYQNRYVFYSINKHTAFGMIEKDRGVFFMDQRLLKNTKTQEFHMFNHWSYLGLDRIERLSLDTTIKSKTFWKNSNYLQLRNKKILLINKEFELKMSHQPIDIHYCLMTTYKPLIELSKSFNLNTVILDGTLPFYHRKRIKIEAEKLGIKSYDLIQEGALSKSFTN
ncbi:MAG: ComEC/Rec2 family competence protein [Flavobacteriales bacterium]